MKLLETPETDDEFRKPSTLDESQPANGRSVRNRPLKEAVTDIAFL
jgi:hypothetical protein